MMRRRRWAAAPLVAAWVAVAVFLGGFATGARGDEPGARKFIESLADKAVAALTVPEISREERVQRFRVLLNDHFDVVTIGQWVLGRYWPQATKEERTEYLKLFEDLIVATYVDRFAEYSGETLAVTKAVAEGEKDTVVFSEIMRPKGGQSIRVDWRVRTREGRYRIIDVMVEGVSMGLTQRSEFASVVRRNGGTVEGLLVELRKRGQS